MSSESPPSSSLWETPKKYSTLIVAGVSASVVSLLLGGDIGISVRSGVIAGLAFFPFWITSRYH